MRFKTKNSLSGQTLAVEGLEVRHALASTASALFDSDFVRPVAPLPSNTAVLLAVPTKSSVATPSATVAPSQSPLALPNISLLASRNALWTYFRQGDTRGTFLYNESTKSVTINSPWELGRFAYGGRWQEFSFELTVNSLSFGNFDLQINNYTLKLGDLVAQAKSGTRVRVVYDQANRTINGFVGNSPVRQASVLVDNWDASFSCTLYSGGGQNARITVANPTVGCPQADTIRPVASFSAVASVVATAVPTIGVRFSEPITGFDPGDLVLTRDGTTVPLSTARLTGVGASYTVTGLSSLTTRPGNYCLTLRSVGSGVCDTVRNPLAGDAVARWSNSISGTPAPVALLANRNALWTYFRQGDTRGTFLYNESTKSVTINSPWELARFVYGGRWQDFSFDLTVNSLSFRNFDLQINNYTLKLGDLAISAGQPTRVRVVYDETTRTISAFFAGSIVSQASVLTPNWNSTFRCVISSGGGGNARVILANPTVR